MAAIFSRPQCVKCYDYTWLHQHCSYISVPSSSSLVSDNGPIARYVKWRIAHAPGMPGAFSPPPPVSDLDKHQGTCVTHVPWCMSVALTSGFLWSRWPGKRSRHSRRMRNPQFYVSGKRPMACDQFSTKALHKPMQTYCQELQLNLNKNIQLFLKKMHFKIWSENVNHSV